MAQDDVVDPAMSDTIATITSPVHRGTCLLTGQETEVVVQRGKTKVTLKVTPTP